MKVGFVGLGKMGFPMARNLVAAGFEVNVYDVRSEAVAELEEAGGHASTTPSALGRSSDVVGICVPHDDDVLAVVEGPGGLLEGLAEGGVLIVHSTILPETLARLEETCGARGVDLIDVMLSGYTTKAETGELTLMIGGPEEVVARCEPYLDAIGSQLCHLGPVGAGAAAKLANNVMTILAHLGAYEGLSIARANGIDVDKMIDVAMLSTGRSDALAQWKDGNKGFTVMPEQFEGLSPEAPEILSRALRSAEVKGIGLPLVSSILALIGSHKVPEL